MSRMAIGVFLVTLALISLGQRRGHRTLYLCIPPMPMPGLVLVFSARLNAIVSARDGAPLPADGATITGHVRHRATALALTLPNSLRDAGALKDRGTIRRMI